MIINCIRQTKSKSKISFTGGLTQIDKYLYSKEDWIKSGALLACGIVNTGVRNECDPALALLSDYVLHSSNVMRLGAIYGLGLAYAGLPHFYQIVPFFLIN